VHHRSAVVGRRKHRSTSSEIIDGVSGVFRDNRNRFSFFDYSSQIPAGTFIAFFPELERSPKAISHRDQNAPYTFHNV
jgi:hypothetical protein